MDANTFKNHLKDNLIPFWHNLKDSVNGGFYGFVDNKLVVNKTYSKGVILNSRILWFFSNAYSCLGTPSLLEDARHAYLFLKDCCLDKENGGLYWSVTYEGKKDDTTKHTYNQAFAIYALSSYYIASGDKEALDTAYSLYHIIESRMRDSEGYLEAYTKDFMPAKNSKLSENGVIATRTMNTLLHIMEGYTELYRAGKSPEIYKHLVDILDIMIDKMYNPAKGSLNVFFDKDYNVLIDLESYGHNIEASWLIDRTVKVLGNPYYESKLQPIIQVLAKTAYYNGYDKIHFAMNYERENDKINHTKAWWVQAETVVGMYNAYQQDIDDVDFFYAATKTWDFIERYVIDNRSGEWFENVDALLEPDYSLPMVHPWKCPYHNGRMCIEMIERLSSK